MCAKMVRTIRCNVLVFHVHKNTIIRKDRTKKEVADYLYECCLSPPLPTFRQAIKKGKFLTWPGVDDPYILKYFMETINTAKGHLDQEMKNL